jgi:hypothetical protein
MLIPNKFNGYQAGRRTYNTGMEPLLIGAAIGGGSAALQGGDPLKGALLGGLTGGIGSGIAGALGGSAGAAGAAGAGASELASVGAADAASGLLGSPEAFTTPISTGESISRSLLPDLNQGAIQAFSNPSGLDFGALNFAGLDPTSASMASTEAAALPGKLGADPSSLYGAPVQAASKAPAFGQVYSGTGPAAKQGLAEMWKNLPLEKKLLYGGAGGLGLMALMGDRSKVPAQAPYTGPLSRFRFNPDTYQAAVIPPRMARGGIADLGAYSDGGRLLKGPGDGMSDHIPATIANKRPARLADGEFVVPADVVSHLGNGSTDAGAKQLYAMMDKVRKARTGNPKQGKQIRPQKFMPA